MFQCTSYKVLFLAAFLSFMACNEASDPLQTGTHYGTIAGKVLHPNNDVLIRVVSEGGVDTITRDPVTQMFTADSIIYGNCLIQVSADGYLLFEKKLLLNEPHYICHDIALSQCPWQIAYLDPSSSQHIDSLFCSLREPSITDTGFLICLTFSNEMDTASVGEVLTILPDTAGVQKLWARNLSLFLYFPYSKFSTIDTIKVSVGSTAKNIDLYGNEALGQDFSFYYTVDTSYIRTSRLKTN